PFCRRLCWFCACRTQGVNSDDPVLAYVATLKQEIAQVGALLPEGVEVARLHWGGGTPTLLGPEATTDLANAVRQHFTMSDDAEFSVEIDPNEIDEARLDALAAAGMTRASIGVQDFDPMIQEVIGRPQSYEITKDAVDGLRERGITSLNADILYGLPHQTRARMSDSVQKLLSLGPDRVALFGYAHVPWMAKRQTLIPTEALPSPEGRLELFNTARDLFLADGFAEIGIDHFALPSDGLEIAHQNGTMRRNFQGYTEDKSEVLIGVGASSISRYPQGFAQNEPATGKYQGRVRAGELASARGHVFDRDDHLRGRIIELILCDFRADLNQVARELDASLDELVAMCAGLEEALPDTTTLKDGVLTIKEHAKPLARIIARHFDAYEMNASGHSQAV
ncbi:oxygen-independent coproporphyrinogen III oxidase, partial [Aliiroseovarius sp.]|uniref:oxygen-independent coproporphyrinogen III oxidase n=1 Tax=Aliiroseovarius sp. TaxID=1872442 RepID=UPI00260B3F8F